MKSVQIRSFFGSVFSCIRTEYGDLLRKSPYSVRIQENTDQKTLYLDTFHEVFFLQTKDSLKLMICSHPCEKNVVTTDKKYLLAQIEKQIENKFNVRNVFGKGKIFFIPVTPSEIEKLIKCLHTNKAAGIDKISPKLKKKSQLIFNSLSANPEKWSNTLKQIVRNLLTICLSVFDHFMNLALKGLTPLLTVAIFLFPDSAKVVSVVSFEN